MQNNPKIFENIPEKGETKEERIYLDYNATTPYAEKIRRSWSELLEIFGNPSSIHFESRFPKTILRETRAKIAKILGCSPLEIIFNSGASEGNATLLKMLATRPIKSDRNEVIISQIEHPSIKNAAQSLRESGFVVHEVPVDIDGNFSFDFFKKCLSEKTILVSVMFANNETGLILPIKEISRLAHDVGAYVHSDCVQMLGKVRCDFQELNLDYATFSAHKMYSLKGVGFMYVKRNSPWQNLIYGGGQERGRRGGTENVLGIAGLNLIVEDFLWCQTQIQAMQDLRLELETLIAKRIPNVSLTHSNAPRLANTSSFVLKDVDGETLLMSLDLKGFSVSTGAACSSGSPEPSPVLLAIGLTREQAQSSLRISLGWSTTREEVVKFVDVLTTVVEKLRQINREEKSNVNVG